MGDRHAAETGRGWEQCREGALGNGQVGDDGDRNMAMLVIVEFRVLTYDSCEKVDV